MSIEVLAFLFKDCLYCFIMCMHTCMHQRSGNMYRSQLSPSSMWAQTQAVRHRGLCHYLPSHPAGPDAFPSCWTNLEPELWWSRVRTLEKRNSSVRICTYHPRISLLSVANVFIIDGLSEKMHLSIFLRWVPNLFSIFFSSSVLIYGVCSFCIPLDTQLTSSI